MFLVQIYFFIFIIINLPKLCYNDKCSKSEVTEKCSKSDRTVFEASKGKVYLFS